MNDKKKYFRLEFLGFDFCIGWFSGEWMTLFKVVLLEVADYHITVFDVTIAKFGIALYYRKP